MGSTIFSGAKVKALKDEFQLLNGMSVINLAADPQVTAYSANAGSIGMYNGKLYRKTDAGSTKNWVDIGTSIEAPNYGAAWKSSFAHYDDGATATPVDGTGEAGATDLAVSLNTTTPLDDISDVKLTKSAANAQGEGCAFGAFAIPVGMKANLMDVSFQYTTSAAYADNDITLWAYDITNSVLIPMTQGYQLKASATPMTHKAQFQTSATGVSYRIIAHVASTNASAYDVYVGMFQFAKYVSKSITPVSDWVSWTPTGSWTSNTTYTGQWRRVGDSAEFTVKVATSGAPTSAALTINLPSGMTIDTAKVPYVQFATEFGRAIMDDSDSTYYYGSVNYSTSTAVIINVSNSSGTYDFIALCTQAAPFTFGAGDSVVAQFKVPILGWGSNVTSSDIDDGRLVACDISLSAPQSIGPNGSYVKINFNSTIKDTHNAFDTGNYKWVCQSSGWYDLSTNLWIASTNVLNSTYAVGFYKNGAAAAWGQILLPAAGEQFSLSCNCLKYLVSGDYIEVYVYGSGNNSVNKVDVYGDSSLPLATKLSIKKAQSSQQISSGEKIASLAYKAADQTGINPNNSAVKLQFDTKSGGIVAYDTHGAFDNVTNYRFTAPVYGFYTVEAMINMSATNILANLYQLRLYVNGGAVGLLGEITPAAGVRFSMSGQETVELNAGSYVELYLYGAGNNSTNTLTMYGASNGSRFGIKKM